jgi:myosin heavy subunit
MAREGIDGSQIQYEDNQGLLDMLLSKAPPGILATIDEEALFPKVLLQIPIDNTLGR